MKTKFLYLSIFLLVSLFTSGQTFKLKGTVVNSENEPLKGVYITTLGSKKDCKISNNKGGFSLKVAVNDTILMITPDEKLFKTDVKKQSDAIFILVDSGKKRDFDGQTLTLIEDAEKERYSEILVRIQKVNVNTYYNTIFEMLKAKYPDLEVNEGSGTINIRGISSLSRNQPALVVVDGVKNMNIRNLNPQDVKRINVIKDGTAAKYGGSASGGVIEITTMGANKR